MLVSGDGTWAKNHIDLMSLQDYQLVILPGVQLISDDEIDALLVENEALKTQVEASKDLEDRLALAQNQADEAMLKQLFQREYQSASLL